MCQQPLGSGNIAVNKTDSSEGKQLIPKHRRKATTRSLTNRRRPGRESQGSGAEVVGLGRVGRSGCNESALGGEQAEKE